jgi:hypothetical protein
MHDFGGGISILVGLGFLGWGTLFLLRYPRHGEGETAAIVGLSAILVGIFLIFLSPRNLE